MNAFIRLYREQRSLLGRQAFFTALPIAHLSTERESTDSTPARGAWLEKTPDRVVTTVIHI